MMGRPSKIDRLPEEMRATIRREIKQRRFSQYRELESWFRDAVVDIIQAERVSSGGERLRESELDREIRSRGWDIDHMAIWRYGQAMKNDEQIVELALDFAEMMQGRLGADAADTMSQSNIYLTQALIHTQLSQMVEAAQAGTSDPDAVGGMAEALSKLVRASLAQKKHAGEVAAQLAKAADKTADLAREQGLSEAAANTIRSKILGIAA
jgi:hypothetical protein